MNPVIVILDYISDIKEVEKHIDKNFGHSVYSGGQLASFSFFGHICRICFAEAAFDHILLPQACTLGRSEGTG